MSAIKNQVSTTAKNKQKASSIKSSQPMTACDTLASSNLLSKSTLPQKVVAINCRKILITGCSSGIGYYCAKKLRDDGHVVVATCRKSEDAKRLIGEGLHAVRLDLDSSDSIIEGIRDALTITNGELDILVNNGAYGQPGAVEDISRAALEQQFSSNVFGTHELTIRLIKTLLVSEYPRIIQISSVLGLVATRYRGAYTASKFALEGLSDALRLELSDTKVKVCLVEPGPIVSKFRQNAKAAFLKNIDIEKSRHVDRYKRSMNRFNSDKKQPFTLSEDAVYQKVVKAIEAKRPKPRYYVTKATYIFGYLRRFLSTKMLDRVLLKVSDGEDQRFNQK